MCYTNGLISIIVILIIYEAIFLLSGYCSFTDFIYSIYKGAFNSYYKTMRQDKKIRTFVWTMMNAFIALGVGYATDSQYAVLLVPMLNIITKEINTKYFNDLGV